MASSKGDTSTSSDDAKEVHHQNLHPLLSLEEERQGYDSDTNLSFEEGEFESTLFSDLPKDELSTPLLAGNDFMELEASHENLAALDDRVTTKKRGLTWDSVANSFKTQVLGNPDEDESISTTASNNIVQNDTVEMNSSVAAVFLRDYESSRPCSLSPNLDSITLQQLEMYNLRFSPSHQFLVCFAMLSLFLASFFEGEIRRGGFALCCQMLFTVFAAFIFTSDIVIRGYYDDDNLLTANMQTLYTRKTRARRWKIPMLLMLMAVTLETAIKIILGGHTIVWSSIFKPIVFFYVSSKARDAFYALMKVTKIVFRVIVIELFLILSFSAMACHLYFEFDAFKDLPSSFISLFELSTTAVTPSLWIPVYNEYRYSAFFFVSFLIICVFYMHSLVLSVVFQIYIQAMKLIRERSLADRQEALNLAFLALRNRSDNDESDSSLVDVKDIRKALQILRPHYNDAKIDVLIQIVDPNASSKIDFNTFRVKIPKVLQTSLRSARQSTSHSLFLESLAFVIAVANLVYVLLLSSALEFLMLANLIIPIGSLIVLLGLFEVTLRIRPFPCLEELSTSRHVFLDSLAIVSGLLSLGGLIMHAFNKDDGLQPLLLGRAIDMIRLLRFSSIFRSIIDRTGDVLPALVGPIALVMTSLHIYTYSGMAIWEGAITIGVEEKITPLYDLNNFNEYSSGLLTMFNIFVVNDWQTIANVYLFADRHNAPSIVYPFFISANLVGVSILLNVLTAFFVGSFVTKVESNSNSQNENKPSLRLRMTSRESSNASDVVESNNITAVSQPTSLGEFHIFERQGYDSVMKTITGDEDEVTYAKRACELLKVFEGLMPSTDQTGYLICCQQSKDCFGNRHFASMTRGYIEEEQVNGVIDEMFSLLLKSGDEKVQRDFPPLEQNDMYHRHLMISASICQSNPPVGMFVATKKWISAVV